jgi:hypothetical protein
MFLWEPEERTEVSAEKGIGIDEGRSAEKKSEAEKRLAEKRESEERRDRWIIGNWKRGGKFGGEEEIGSGQKIGGEEFGSGQKIGGEEFGSGTRSADKMETKEEESG